MLTHGPHELLRHFQGVKYFARYQRLRLETPGWRVLDFEGNPLSENELKCRKEFIFRGPLVIRDREYLFAEDLIVDDSGAPDAALPVLAKVLSLIEVLRLGGLYEVVHQLWSHITLTASRVIIDMALSRDEVLVGNSLFDVSTYSCALAYWYCVLVDNLNGMYPRILSRVFGWVETHGQYSIEFEERDSETWCWCGHGKDPHFDVFVWRCWADSAPTIPWRLQC